MHKLLLVPFALILMSGSAFAQWEIDDVSDEQGYLYVAYNVDRTDTIEVQLSCDELLDGHMLLTIFTGDDLGKSKGDAVLLTAEIGEERFEDLVGETVDIEGEKVLDFSEGQNASIRDLASAIGEGDDLVVSYEGDDWTIPGTDAAEAIRPIFKHCP